MKLVKPHKKRKIHFKVLTPPKPKAYFQDFTCEDDYKNSGCLWNEPMLAKEIAEAEQNKFFTSEGVYVEEKFDGTRGILQFFDNKITRLKNLPIGRRGYTRCFSRRVSRKTGWFCENTDSVPQLRDINRPELAGTVIDGEMFVDGKPFKVVSAIMNCLWNEAVSRQTEQGKVVFHAFDILYYKDYDVRELPLSQRKDLLQKVIDACNSPYLVMVPYCDTQEITVSLKAADYLKLSSHRERYPELWKCAEKSGLLNETKLQPNMWVKYKLSKKAYYEYIVLMGGEGVILKPSDGVYRVGKRGKEYMKVKKFLTREVIITGFIEPQRMYTGGFPKDTWAYWVDENDEVLDPNYCQGLSAKYLRDKKGYTPVTKPYFNKQIGAIEYGVILEKDDVITKEFVTRHVFVEGVSKRLIVVGECTGFTEEERVYFTENREELVGSVIEVKANEVFKDTGKMRHPRFIRMREDKSAEECTWKNHIGVD